MQSLSERTAGFTDSVIRRMTRVSMQYGAVNLSQGFPDFEPPKEILDRMAQVAYEDFHQYSITWGSQNFREALAAKQSRCMGRKIDPNTEIVTTCGSTEAMMAAMMTVTNPGDKVIIFSPFYENYGADTILSDDVKQTICGATKLHADNILNQLRELQVDLRSNPAIFIGGGSILLRPFLEQSPLVAKADFVDNPNANALGYEMLGNQKLHILTQAPGSEGLA